MWETRSRDFLVGWMLTSRGRAKPLNIIEQPELLVATGGGGEDAHNTAYCVVLVPPRRQSYLAVGAQVLFDDLREIWRAKDADEAIEVAEKFICRYGRKHPEIAESLR